MKRIAAPMIGGIVTSFLLELVVYPAVYQIWKWNFELKRRIAPMVFVESAKGSAVETWHATSLR